MITKSKPKISNKGFALISTIIIMSLLLMLSLAMLNSSTVEQKTTNTTNDQERARANAKLALTIAIAELQQAAGPDQRVTATASILDTSPETIEIDGVENPHWLGSWNTSLNGQPTVGNHDSNEYLSDLRNTSAYSSQSWKDQYLNKWLVSGNPSDARDAVSGDSIFLVKEGTAGDDVTRHVRAPLVEVSDGESKGSYAWWISDQALKIRMNTVSPYASKVADKTNPDDGGYYNLMGAQNPALSFIPDRASSPFQGFEDMTPAEIEKIISFNETTLANFSSAAAADISLQLKKSYHDLGVHQLSVYSDPVNGGLQKDLTTLLEGPASGVRGITSLNLPSVKGETPIIPGAHHTNTGPKLEHLRSWYQLKNTLTSPSLGKHEGDPNESPNTFYGGDQGYAVDYVSARQTGLQPYIADCKLQWDFSKYGTDFVRLHLYPTVTLWNPHNVTLKGQRYLIMVTRPPIHGGNVTVGGKALLKTSENNNWRALWGSPAHGSIYFVTEPVDIGPGEALVFTPKVSGGIAGSATPYNPNSFDKNVLTATDPVSNTNFYVNSTLKVDPTVNLSNKPVQYGLPTGVNSSIGWGSVCYLKDAAGSGSISLGTVRSQQYATIHRIRNNYNGDKTSWWWYVYNKNNHPANNASSPGFDDYATTSNRKSPRLWYIQFRNRWFDEAVERISIGQRWGRGTGLLYGVPSVSLYNMRATVEHRSPFSYYQDWTRYAPVGKMIPWASEQYQQNPDFSPSYVNGKNLGSPFGPHGIWTASNTRYPLFDVPNKSTGVLSLANFQHAQVSYLPWHPSYVIGSAHADPRSDRQFTSNKSYLASTSRWQGDLGKHRPGVWDRMVLKSKHQITSGKPEVLIYDIAYETNHHLWDQYFLSSIPFNASGSANPTVDWEPTTGDTLPLGRNIVNPFRKESLQDIKDNLSSEWDYAFYRGAEMLMKQGGFSVQSTSVEAWKAVLGSLAENARPTADGTAVAGNTFSRFLVPIKSNATPTNARSEATWQGLRNLSDSEITFLAEKMVEEVKIRAPFLGMSDFVNRRLITKSNDPKDTSMFGSLQSAIEKADINQIFHQADSRTTTEDYPNGGSNKQHASGGRPLDIDSITKSKAFAFPAYLTQADVLQSISPMLTARGDTFVIRAYGEAKDSSGRVTARAWCEATVQRTPEFMDPTNDAHTPVTLPDGSANPLKRVPNPALSEINQKFGRKFVITNFRWLSPKEI